MNQIQEYSQTDAALATLREKYTTFPSVETKEGYAEVKAGIKEVDGYRTSLEKTRKEIKAPALERCKLIDAEAKRITTELVEIAEPMKAAKKEIDEREKRLKEERIARLQVKVNELVHFPAQAVGKSPAQISELIDRLGEIDTSHDFYDLTSEAVAAQSASMSALAEMLTQAIAQEQEAARRAEENARLEAQRIEMEREREEFRKQQEAFEAQQAEIRKQQEDLESQQREAQRKIDEQLAHDAEQEALRVAEQEKPVIIETSVEPKPYTPTPIEDVNEPVVTSSITLEERKIASYLRGMSVEQIAKELVNGSVPFMKFENKLNQAA